MAKLISEYIDIKNVSHNVEHLTLPAAKERDRERIMDELIYALTKTSRLKSAQRYLPILKKGGVSNGYCIVRS